MARRALLGALVAFAAVLMFKRYGGPEFGFDFHGGAWEAAKQILRGQSPYPPADPHLLFRAGNLFVTPPILGELAIPVAWLHFKLAATLWALLNTAAFVGALRLLGLRDGRLYLIALCSFPFADTIQVGQSDGLLALCAALAWRYRDSPAGGVATGALIAAKLLAWPLLIWLLVTKRIRSALTAVVTAAGLLMLSWAPIQFHGMASYPALLSADAKAFEGWTYSNSILGAMLHLGISSVLATMVSVVLALVVAAIMVVASRRSDRGWFAACLVFGLLVSPILWPHYLLLLFVPLAIVRPRSPGPWVLTVLLWIAQFNVSPAVRAGTLIGTSIAVAIWTVTTTDSAAGSSASLTRRGLSRLGAVGSVSTNGLGPQTST